MIILGLHITGKQTSAAIFKNGKIEFAVAEERITRNKHSRAFPINAIKQCLDFVNIDCISKVDAICISWNPVVNMNNINISGFTNWKRYEPEWLYIAPNNILELLKDDSIIQDTSMLLLDVKNNGPKIYYVEHHLSHLSHAVFHSTFKECSCLISDEYSENYSITFAKLQNNQIEVLERIEFPYSIGAFYAMATEFLGFKPDSDEWKVMGAGAYGDSKRFSEKLKKLIYWDQDNNELYINLQYINNYNLKVGTYISKKFEKYIGLTLRKHDEELLQIHYDFAASVQKVFEDTMFDILDYLYNKTKIANLVLSGGSFMNSLFNGKILENSKFEHLYIPFAPADNGNSIGSAFWVAHSILKTDITRGEDTPYLGLEFDNYYVENTLKQYKLKYLKVDNIEHETAKHLSQNKIVGWFQGRMEFGERALGNRSILANPNNSDMKDKINASIKFREKFRPFAPAILDEYVNEYFEIPSGADIPFMEQVYTIKKEKRDVIPATVHKDNTGRLQVVNKNRNKKFHNLISEFYKLTNIPVLINTSFNVNGEPIVYTPEDAIKTFFTSGLDVLVLNDFIIVK